MGVNMFDNFEQFEPSAATKYAKRVDRFLYDWVPKNRPVIDEFTRLLNQIVKSVPKALTLDTCPACPQDICRRTDMDTPLRGVQMSNMSIICQSK